MPKELLCITSGIRWVRTTIRPVGGWLQTELYFDADGHPLSVAFDALPDRTLLLGATTIRNLYVHEAIEGEPAFSGACRYRVRFLAGEPPGEHEAFGTYVRYGPMNSAPMPPPMLDGAHVLWWTWSGDVPFGELPGATGDDRLIYGFAVYRYDSGELFRFSCNKHWEVVQDMDHQDEDEARADIPSQYDTTRIKWRRYSAET